MQIQYKEYENGGMFYIEQEQRNLAEITYQWKDDSTIIADHTRVDDALKGQGVARQLLDALVEFARKNKLKIVPLCSYVEVMFRRDQSLADVKA
ncbi:GNAT family N-acetyltransferase [Acinetobacter equi]|jgi:uncharacterized protein|uniref:Acetyltransferase n=1 Tax=Acinetobacter equi TaxID=1324350 RepID=A0A0N7GXI0_9GAMM|nr:GNAT family N-acetyltransferase [Acinetobacter equi]ALH94771.1 acetyltransferase [Acinetobacter equi]